MRHSLAECTWIAGGDENSIDHAECVAFGPDGRLYTGGEAGQVFRMEADGSSFTQYATTEGALAGVALDAAGVVYVCDYGNGNVQRIAPAGDVSLFSVGVHESGVKVPNFGVFATDGTFYYSDSGSHNCADGEILAVLPDGRTDLAYGHGLYFPNGLAIDPTGEWLYIAQSTAANIVRLPLADMDSFRPELVARLPAIPDGLAFAVSGNLYVACIYPYVIYIIEPNGSIDVLIEGGGDSQILWGPANMAFRPGTTDLYFVNHAGWTIASAPVGEVGMPLNYPRFD